MSILTKLYGPSAARKSPSRPKAGSQQGSNGVTAPTFPVVRAVVDQTGAWRVDGQLIAPQERETNVQAALRVIAARAATRPSETIRVVVVDEQDRTFRAVVTSDAQLHELDDNPRNSARVRRQRRAAVAVAAGGVVLFGGAGVGAYALTSGSRAATAHPTVVRVTQTPKPVATQLPASGPAGWSAIATWASPAVATVSSGANQSGAVSVAGGTVFAVLGDATGGQLRLAQLSSSTGQPVWSHAIKGSGALSAPVVATINGHPMVMAATDAAVSGFALDGTKGQSWPVPQTATDPAVTLTTAGPIINASSTSASVVDAAGHLVTRSLPANGRGWWPAGKGVLIATDAGGHAWHTNDPRVAGAPTSLKGPAGATSAGTVTATNKVLVSAWRPKNSGGDQVQLVGYAIDKLTPAWTTSAAVTAPSDGASVVLSPDQRWLGTGNTVIDLSDGHVTALPDGDTVSVIGARVWARTSDGQVVVFDHAGHAVASPAGSPDDATAGTAAAPVAELGSSVLVSAASDAGQSRVYLLPATAASPSSSSSAPSSSAPKPTATKAPTAPAKKEKKK